MKTNLPFFTLLSLSIVFFSCSQEDLNTLSKIENPVQLQNVRSQNDRPYDSDSRSVIAATLSPCGGGFNVSITGAGGLPLSPIIYSFMYDIHETAGPFADSGIIVPGGSTPWVLDPCTEYEFRFWRIGSSPAHAIGTIIAMSDGCGSFVC